jgi:rhodanese-related sulfurtransferase
MSEVTRTLLEFMLVGLTGLILGLAANHFNNDGLELGRDYFAKPVVNVAATQPANAGEQSTGQKGQPAVGKTDQDRHDNEAGGGIEDYARASRKALEAQMAALGVSLVAFEQVKAWFEDPGYEYGVYVFVDARNEEQYQEGHIPGAWLLDHYRIERYIDRVLPMCRGAEKIVAYCAGGECEDSEFVVGDLITYGIDPGVIYLYADGLEDWEEKGMPVELGQRGSGRMRGGKS